MTDHNHETWKCKSCGICKEKSKNNFRTYIRKGKLYWDLECRKCVSARKVKLRKDYPKEVRAKDAAYRASNPVGCRRATMTYRERHKEKRTKWKRENQEKLWKYHREKSKQWYKDNPEKATITAHKSRAKRQSLLVGEITKDQLNKLFASQKFRCAICRQKLINKKHLDHIMPLSKGGLHEIKNLQYLCPTCNLRKSAIHPIDFMQKLGFLL